MQTRPDETKLHESTLHTLHIKNKPWRKQTNFCLKVLCGISFGDENRCRHRRQNASTCIWRRMNCSIHGSGNFVRMRFLLISEVSFKSQFWIGRCMVNKTCDLSFSHPHEEKDKEITLCCSPSFSCYLVQICHSYFPLLWTMTTKELVEYPFPYSTVARTAAW